VAATFGTLTPPQRAAIPAVHAGRHLLVAAPTGTGKTLAAFLAVISELVADAGRGELPAAGIRAVYVSPLRALGADVQRNLERPLAEICAAFMPGCADPTADESDPRPASPIRVASRTGDTTQADRRRLAARPPHILVTTPESLAILLSTPAFRRHFRGVRWVVVDEVHALAGNKRGVHLALSLERLAAAAEHDPVRVGLSATVSPPEVVARWLVGPTREAEVVAWHAPRDARFDVESAVAGEVVPSPQAVQRAVADRVADRIERHRTTLVFTNTRGATERLAHRLKARFGDEAIAAHHSSLAREERQRVEERLRAASSGRWSRRRSLELGIDIGTIDETVLVSSPRDVTRALQRIGRSGHRIDRHRRGASSAPQWTTCSSAPWWRSGVARGRSTRCASPGRHSTCSRSSSWAWASRGSGARTTRTRSCGAPRPTPRSRARTSTPCSTTSRRRASRWRSGACTRSWSGRGARSARAAARCRRSSTRTSARSPAARRCA
jgi:ATP-dependent Lhr-like helicase